jgi:hypothetical protein
VKSVLLSFVVLAGAAGFSGCSDPEADRAETAAAEAAKAAEARVRDAAAAKREVERLADLWTYSDTPAGKGRQLSTYLYSTEGVDTDGQGAKRVQLVFRDHPAWGRSSYLVLQGGDFNCYSGCTVKVTVDDAAAKPMAGRRPKTDEAIAMFINDEMALWRMTAGATRIGIEFPVSAGGTRTATFEVAGLNRSKMPGWDR